ncbi:MAG: PA14 domain-containing protein, partial [Synechococcaceae cyanobacterium]
DGDDLLDQDDAYRIPFRRSLLGDWLEDQFAGLPEFFGVLTGGDGNDVLRGSTAATAVPVVYLDGGLGDDVLYGSDVDQYFDILLGQEGDDLIVGLRGPNRLEGGSGNDELRGGFNNDVLLGGSGRDLLIGGEGFDTVSHREDAGAAQVNLSWREQPVVLLPGSGDAVTLAPATPLQELPAALQQVLTAMASRGFRRFDPLTSLRELLAELCEGEAALLPELADITATNPVLWIPTDPDAQLVRLDRTGLLRDVQQDVREAIETALLRQGVAPRSSLSVVEAARLAASSQLLDLGSLKLIATAVSAYASRDGWGDHDRLQTAIFDLPGSSVAEAALARDAARLLALPTNLLRDRALELQREWQVQLQAIAAGNPSPPGTPIADEISVQLLNSFTAASADALIEAGRSGDLTVWLNAFARAIATEQPADLSSRAVAEALSGVLSQIEAIEGSEFNDVLIGDNQHNTIQGGSGHDVLLGDRGNDVLDGGSGHDQIHGGEGADRLEGGGGRDLLVGGPGDDRYSLRTPLLTLEQAFRSLGGDPRSLQPIELDGEVISWEKFRLWADPRRWRGEVQWQHYERLGFMPDQLLYRRAAADDSVGWLRMTAGGTVIRDQGGLSGAEDELTLELPQLLSLDGVQEGSIGVVRGNGAGRTGNNDLLIDLDADGVVNPARDLTIENYFAADGSGSGAISAIRQYGLIGDYYFGADFQQRFLRRVDASIDFDWGYLLPSGSDLDNAKGLPSSWDGALSARWRGQLQPGEEGFYRFRVTADDGRANAWELFVDGEKIDSAAEQLRLRADRPVDLELRWRDPAVAGSSGDHAIKLEWSLNGGAFATIGSEALRTGVTITSLDVLGSTDLLVPELNRELFTADTSGWEGGVAWGDVDNDTDLDLLHWGFDSLGNGEAQILINDIDGQGRRSFNASFDLPVFDLIHQAEWGDWN